MWLLTIGCDKKLKISERLSLFNIPLEDECRISGFVHNISMTAERRLDNVLFGSNKDCMRSGHNDLVFGSSTFTAQGVSAK